MTASLLLAALGLAILLCMIMTGAWIIALKSGQSGWVDTIWSLGVGIVGVVAALLPLDAVAWGIGPAPRQWLVAALCGLWGVRLAAHIGGRTHGSGDDPRYAKLKADWGDHYVSQFFWFLQIQALAAWILVLASLVAAHVPGAHLRWQDWLGLGILAIAIIGEWLSDRQLTAFKRDASNRGKVCDVGLWSWSRHPNYFFEWLGWCAYPVIAIPVSSDYLPGYIAVLAPVMMYWLLVHVSGIPPLEAHMQRSRGALFADYQRRTSAFWPLPPRD